MEAEFPSEMVWDFPHSNKLQMFCVNIEKVCFVFCCAEHQQTTLRAGGSGNVHTISESSMGQLLVGTKKGHKTCHKRVKKEWKTFTASG